MLQSGMKIKIFPETDTRAYIEMISVHGFNSEVHHDYILIKERKKLYDEVKIGRLIRKKRIAKKIYREQLAEIIGVTEDTVRRWEFGMQTPKSARLEKIIELLEIDGKELKECRTQKQ